MAWDWFGHHTRYVCCAQSGEHVGHNVLTEWCENIKDAAQCAVRREGPRPPTLSVTSGDYPIGDADVLHVLAENAPHFSDRSFVMTDIPDQLTGLGYFLGPTHTKAEIDLTTSRKQDIYIIVSNGELRGSGSGPTDKFKADMQDGGFAHVTAAIDGIDTMHTTSFGGDKGFQAWHAVVDGTKRLDFRNADEITIVYSLGRPPTFSITSGDDCFLSDSGRCVASRYNDYTDNDYDYDHYVLF